MPVHSNAITENILEMNVNSKLKDKSCVMLFLAVLNRVNNNTYTLCEKSLAYHLKKFEIYLFYISE